jgi:hypothetical protein
VLSDPPALVVGAALAPSSASLHARRAFAPRAALFINCDGPGRSFHVSAAYPAEAAGVASSLGVARAIADDGRGDGVGDASAYAVAIALCTAPSFLPP